MVRRSLLFVSLMLLSVLAGVQMVVAQSGFDTRFTEIGNIRTGPGTDFDVVDTVAGGTLVRIDGRNQSGNWVRGITEGGTVGWFSSGLVDINLSQITGLPIIDVDTPFLLGAPSAGGGQASAPSAAVFTGGTPATAQDNLNMRSGPGVGFDRVGGVDFGQTLRLDGRNNAGDWVRGVSPAGTVGWVSARFITLDDGTLDELSVVSQSQPFSLDVPNAAPPEPEAEAEAPAAPVEPVTNTAPVTGFSYGGHVQGLSDSTADLMRYAGMTWVKKQFRYSDGQSPNAVAGMINSAHSKGFRILIGVVGTGAEDPTRDGYVNRYAEFVAGVAALGADGIEIWNEPNITREWRPLNPGLYTDLLRASYNAIKAANPNTLVVGGAPAPTGAEAAFPGEVMNDDNFLRQIAAAGAANYMDCMGVHYNEGILPPTATSGDPRGNSGHYTRYLRSMMDVYSGALRKPLCFTELGYLSPEGYGPLPQAFSWAADVSIAEQAQWLDQAINITRSSGRVRLVIIWNVNFLIYFDYTMAGYAILR